MQEKESVSVKKRFIEIPEKKMVIAMLDKKYSAVDEVKRINHRAAFILNRTDFIFGRAPLANSYFKSIARCNGNDTYDRKIGRNIARRKVDYKYHKSMANQYNYYIRLLEDIIAMLEQLRNEHIQERLHIESEMQEYK
jgi:hypothetical protein